MVNSEHETTTLIPYSFTFNGMKIIIYDSPGLQGTTDGDDDFTYLADMKKISPRFDLFIFCIRMIDNRLTHDGHDVVIMKQLRDTFGDDYWKHAVVVLTFANSLEAVDIDIQLVHDSEQKTRMFQDRCKEWKDIIRQTLVADLYISSDIAEKVPIVAAGHYRTPVLFDKVYWQSQLWLQCFQSMTS